VPSDSEAFGGLFPFLFSDISIDSTRAHGSERAPTPPDAIDRGVLDLETASDAFKYFITKIAQRLPIVAFHQNISVVQCRSSTPVLFLAILIAASGKYQSNLQATLLDEFHKIIADQVVYQGQKRLELVQGILISLFWIPPPDRLEDMKFGMMAHLAASMIQDLRLKSARYHPMGDRGSRQKILGQSSVNGDESTTIEGHRTLLGCYCACAMLSLVLRRATILPFNDIMSQSLDTIRESPEALPTDKMLVAWVELQRISVDLTEVKNATPNPATSPTSENMKVWLCRTFESRLLNWKESTSVDIQEQGMFY
jgi:hypothetical protein